MVDLAGSEGDALDKRRATRDLIAYFALTFAITWGLAAAVLLFRPQFEAVFGPLGPITESWPFYVAACGPTISAVLLSVIFGGAAGLKSLFRGLVRPVQIRWVILALLSFPVAYLVWGVVERLVFGVSSSINVLAVLTSLPLLAFTTPIIFIDSGPWGEETGWRGFALPRLLMRFSPVTAAVILGAAWSVWHLPAFFAEGTAQSHFNFGWFLVRDIFLSIFMTWLYLRANRNFLVAGSIPHLVNNLAFGAHVFTDQKVDALVMISIVALVIVAYGPSLKGWRNLPASLG
jgi:membrane protease YdiL (CAAX protease family)